VYRSGAGEATVDFIIGASTPHPQSFIRDGEVLWAILPDGETYRLAKRAAQVQIYEYENPARGDEKFTGQRLLGPGASQALIHLAGSVTLRDGPVVFAKTDHVLIDYSFGKEITPPTPATFALGGRVFRVLAELRPADGDFKSLRVILEEGDERQELYSSGRATDPFAALAWIGDLDRDGRPDLLLSVRYHYSTVSHRLYLSSFAAGKELTRHVGSVEVPLD
jgi:hypothetical protein